MKSDGIIKIVVIGGVAYVAYMYLQKSGLWAQWFGGATAAGLPAGSGAIPQMPAPGQPIQDLPTGYQQQLPAGTVAQTPLGVPVSVQPQPATGGGTPAMSLQDQLQTLGNGYMQDNGLSGLNWDQWSYYYQYVTGKTITPEQFGAILQAAGASHDQVFASAGTFLNSLNAAGLSGIGAIVPVPNSGPATAPVAPPISMNFNASRFGGRVGFSAGRGIRNRGVQ